MVVVVVVVVMAEADTANSLLQQFHILTPLHILVACDKVGGANNY